MALIPKEIRSVDDTVTCTSEHVPEHILGWRQHGLSQLKLLDASNSITTVRCDDAIKNLDKHCKELLKQTNIEVAALARARDGLMRCYHVVVTSYGSSRVIGQMLKRHVELLAVDLQLTVHEENEARRCAGADVDPYLLEDCDVALLYTRSYVLFINDRACAHLKLLTEQQQELGRQGMFTCVQSAVAATAFEDARVLLTLEYQRVQQAAGLLLAVSPTGGQDVLTVLTVDLNVDVAQSKKQRLLEVTCVLVCRDVYV